MEHSPIAWDPTESGCSPALVAAPAGLVRGVQRDGVALFRGIPYAEAPTGARRFAAPVDAEPRPEIDATWWGAVSLQDLDPLPHRIPGTEGYYYAPGVVFSEDCLFLNIWSGSPAGAGSPVLVWFHGGGFTWGSSTGPWVDGTRFSAEHGIVVVSVTYRLGVFGNLWLGDLDPAAANFGIQDQQSALRWVQRNIEAFGGDPARVTVMGQSAGALSVAAHLASPGSRGLFSGAAMLSGHLSACPSVEEAKEYRRRIFDDAHVDADGDVLAQLRRMAVTRLQQAQRSIGLSTGGFPLVTDGVVMPESPLDAVAAGSGSSVPLLLGTDSEEQRLWSITDSLPPIPVDTLLGSLLGGDPALISEARRLYADLDLDEVALSYLIATDQAWVKPCLALAEAHTRGGGAAHLYEFTRRSPIVAGVHDTEVGSAHLSELPFFWGNLDAPGVAEFCGPEVLTSPSLGALADAISGTVAQFVVSGSPDGASLGPWPATTPLAPTTMVLAESGSGAQPNRNAERVAFWRRQMQSPALPDLVS